MALSVYVCAWRTGTATFYVNEQPSHRASIVGFRSPEATDPAESCAIQEAMRELKQHLNRPYRSGCHASRQRRRTASEFVWFPSLDTSTRQA